MTAAVQETTSGRCGVCGARGVGGALLVHDTRFGLPRKFRVCRCDRCDAFYTDGIPGGEFLTSLYEDNYVVDARARRPQPPTWRKRLSWWLHGITDPPAVLNLLPRGRVLDFGCHDGSTMAEMENRGMEPYGVDINPKAVEAARRRGFPVHHGTIDSAPWPSDFFDAVFMGYVIEHLMDPAAELRALRRLLKPGGRLFVSTQNSDSYYRAVFRERWIGWHVPYHLHHFNPRSLERLAQETGYRVMRCWSRTPTPWAAMSIRIGMRDRFGRPHRNLYAPLGAWISLPFSLLNRCLDAFLPGDCLMAILEPKDRSAA